MSTSGVNSHEIDPVQVFGPAVDTPAAVPTATIIGTMLDWVEASAIWSSRPVGRRRSSNPET